VLGVVGSVTPTTFGALDALPEDRVVAIDGERAVTDPETAVERGVDAVRARLEEGPVVLTMARERADVTATRSAGRDADLSPAAVSERVAATLADAAATVQERVGVGGLVLSGGATAAAVLSSLGAVGTTLTGRTVAAGVPIGRVDGGTADGLPVVTRAGAFGGPETLGRCLRALRWDGG
jgi:uncharacterized protein YgbK (DUF1537 family)